MNSMNLGRASDMELQAADSDGLLGPKTKGKKGIRLRFPSTFLKQDLFLFPCSGIFVSGSTLQHS